MKNLLVLSYIDALDSSFLTPDIMPFLCSLAAKGSCHSLENVLGYSFAIQACMLSGKYPEENDHWMPYFYSPESSPNLFKTLNKVGSVLPLDKLPLLRYLTVTKSRQLFLNNGVHANNTPLSIIDKLSLFPYYYMCDLPFFPELGNTLERCRSSLKYLGPPRIRGHFYSSLLSYIRMSENENEVVILYDDILDNLGHGFGPLSREYLQYAKSLDEVLMKVYQNLKNNYKDHFVFLVFSDHGQSQRVNSFDIFSTIEAEHLKLAEDYVCFVDATMALFWATDDLAKEKLKTALNSLKVGTLIDESLKKKYNLRFKKKSMYGDYIYVANPGWAFFPNFFSPFGAMKGLHGYLPENRVQKAFLVSDKAFDFNVSHVKDMKELIVRLASTAN
jgi:hypothetical protein